MRHNQLFALAASGIGALALFSAPSANAYTLEQDAQYVACAADGGVTGSSYSVADMGEAVTSDISVRGYTPLAERNRVMAVYAVDLRGANVAVNCATKTYLGYGPRHTTDTPSNTAAVV
jgi:hypothetical protein